MRPSWHPATTFGRRARHGLLVSGILAAASLLIAPSGALAGPAPVDLGTAEPFAILAGTPNITESPTSAIVGDVGLSPATGAGIGLLCTQVTGTIYAVNAAGNVCFTANSAPLLTTAKDDLTAAYLDVGARGPVTPLAGPELGGLTLVPGVYANTGALATTFQISAGPGPLVLDAQGDLNGVFIFQMASGAIGLTVGSGSTVSLINGAQACNIWWWVNTAAIDTTAVFKGTILALTSITVANGADIEGRLLARNGNVTLINDTITRPATCVVAVAPTTPTVVVTGTPSGSGIAPIVPILGTPTTTG